MQIYAEDIDKGIVELNPPVLAVEEFVTHFTPIGQCLRRTVIAALFHTPQPPV